MALLTWNEFAPDQDPITPGALQDMDGVYPVEKGFRTLPGLASISSGITGTVVSAFSGYLINNPLTVMATVNALYVVPQAGGPVIPQVTGLTNTVNRWRFSIYGQDMIAVNGVDAPYYYRQSNGSFQILPGSPPVSALTATTDYAVILVPPNSNVLYSNLSDTASWTPNVATEVYQYTLAQLPGVITAVTRKRSYLAVYRASAIQSATFVGGTIGWDFGVPGTISTSYGAPCQEAVINTGDYDYFVSQDFDFWSFDGYNLNRIPNHCKEFFKRDLNQNAIQNIAGRFDVGNNLVVWHYPSNSTARGQAGNLDSYIGFYQRPQPPRWFFGRLPIDIPLLTPAPDPLHPRTTPDSGIVQTDHQLYLYDDANPYNPVSGVYVTSNDFGDRQHVFQCNRILPGFTLYPVPTFSNTPAKCTPLVQMICGTTPTAKPTKAISDDGWFNVVASGRLMRFQINFYGPAEITDGQINLMMTGEV